MVVDVEGRVADIERSFHILMRTYQHPRETRTFHAPDTEPTLDLAIPVLHISGLDDYSLPHPNLKLKPAAMEAKVTPQSGSGPGGAYRGSDFRKAYSVGSLTGTGQSVGLLQFDGYYASDIATYASQAGIPSITLTNVPIDGGVSTPGSGGSEVSLDIEMVMAMAPGVSRIIVYEAPNPSPWVDLLSRMANDNLAKQLSCSWGGGSADPTSEQVFRQMAAQGQSFFNATGDSDAFTGFIDFPSDSTNITQVGGTTLTTGAGSSYASETVWNWGLTEGDYVGSSGGVSTTYAIPAYQKGINMTANLGSTTMRNVPDVALTGDNVYVIYNNGITGNFGGTSCAAPLWAGFMALVNQQAAQGGHSPVGFINPAIYMIGKSNANYANIFHDITTGNNFSGSSPSKYPAVTGYDLCTGWGTPNGTNLINMLAPIVLTPVIAGTGSALIAEGCQPTNGFIDSGEIVTVNFSLADIGTVNATNLVATLLETNGVVSPSGPQNYGALTGGGSAVTEPFSFTALGSCGGTITATFHLQDGTTDLGLVAFNFQLGGMAASFVENFDGVSAPSLPAGWTTSGGGGQSGWVTSSSVRDSLPNAAFSAAVASVGTNALVSPNISLPSGAAGQLSFRNNYNLEARALDQVTGYDGGVLEIKIGSGAFTDIVTAGGSFVTNGYNRTLATTGTNPLKGRQAWSGNSSGFITTVVNLPASTSGQTIQLRWRCATDASLNSVGWYIDSVTISNYVCCSGSVADLSIGNSSPAAINVSSNVTFTLTVTNLGPDAASGVIVTDALPVGLTFSTASVSQGAWSNTGDSFSAVLGSMASLSTATVTIQAVATAAGQWTNSASVSSSTADASSVNNTSAAPIFVNSAPTISGITNVVTSQNVATGPIGFVIADAETAASSLILSATSSNPSLIDSAHIVFGGSGGSRNVTLTPQTDQYGSCTVFLSVSDGMASTTTSFIYTVSQANHPAFLGSVPDFTIFEKDVLTFTNSASDSDSSQTLTYSLSNAPAGATIGTGSGVFAWTPTEPQGPSTNTITVIVTDNGTPPMSASRTFTVAVLESNEPPVLAAIADRVIHQGMTLVVSNSATDPDVPTNTLTFSLDSGIAGANINSTNGVLLWTPDSSFVNTTNTITVMVTDDNPWAVNTQHLSDAKSFSVVVAPLPTFSSAVASNGTLMLNWSAISGQTYRVQYSTSLAGGNWIDLSPDVTASNLTAGQSVLMVPDAQRFYRVLVVP
jgi:uncharacterized repeat protein (TIGR01451 family)